MDARILAEAMQNLKMKSYGDIQTYDILPVDLCRETSVYEIKSYPDSLASKVVDEFVVNDFVQK